MASFGIRGPEMSRQTSLAPFSHSQETAPNHELQHRAEDSDTSRDRGLPSEFAHRMTKWSLP
jgi:hypothetical protein